MLRFIEAICEVILGMTSIDMTLKNRFRRRAHKCLSTNLAKNVHRRFFELDI